MARIAVRAKRTSYSVIMLYGKVVLVLDDLGALVIPHFMRFQLDRLGGSVFHGTWGLIRLQG